MLTTAEQAAITSGRDFWHTAPVESAGLPAVTVTDGPHGVRMQASSGDLLSGVPATCFPPAVASASTWDPGLLRRMGEALGDECRAQDVAVLLGPGVNLKRSPLGGRNFEYFSEDPILTGVLATEWVLGLQSRGVGASLKHFAVNSQETDRMRVSADVDERTLREMYLRAFHRVVTRAQPWTVMCAYNKVNGVYASEHHWLLTEVLRGEWGFEGLVVSDWGAVVDRVRSIAAGLDLTMPGPDEDGDRALVTAVETGQLDPHLLETSASRVRKMVEKAGKRPAGTYDAEAHHALAREIAGRAIVLLKNDGGLLPLSTDGRVAVLGEFARTPRYQGGGSSQITPTRLDDALTAIRETGATVTFAAGYSVESDAPDQALLTEAETAARESDVAIVFAGSVRETEGADRTSIDLPPAQLALIERVVAANPRVIVVLSNGAVLATKPWDEKVPALVESWLLGQAGGSAIADVLFGRVNPSGRLAETIPLKLADHPSYLDFPGENSHVRYGEGLHVGYRGFDARQQEVAYPFGFGLSYTTFTYGAVEQDGLHIRVPVTNTGDRDGREVVQLYVSLPGSAVQRAPRELKAFASVEIAAGATEEVVLTVEREDLAYWETRLGRWVVEGGDYTFEIGSSSRDIRATVTVTVEGDAARVPLTADSSVGEWFADPRGAELLTEAFMAAMASGGDGVMGSMVADPDMLMMLGSLPLIRMAKFPGSPLSPEAVEKLVAAANL
ncbi:glycoside hydrolase family 3 C-terminal domain-containing protein [Actinoplanes sp. NPDC051861]|uniref:glycoside hydrolase family 3 C-terminal domain-containing protein n=1 Tax=Actinoplanes sp. NPDC051861 TaxID=3155170 RepID=UPI0034337AF6